MGTPQHTAHETRDERDVQSSSPLTPNPTSRQGQILTLLGYPQVGPLDAKAIARNLGTDEHDLQADLETLLHTRRLVRLEDGRLTVPCLVPAQTASLEPDASQTEHTGSTDEAIAASSIQGA